MGNISFRCKGYVFIPEVCFNWKIDLCKKFGKQYVEIRSVGLDFKESHIEALKLAHETGMTYIHPFDDEKVIEGNATMVRPPTNMLGNRNPARLSRRIRLSLYSSRRGRISCWSICLHKGAFAHNQNHWSSARRISINEVFYRSWLSCRIGKNFSLL